MVILVAIDETEESKYIVSIAHELATKYDDTLVVLHVISNEDTTYRRSLLRAFQRSEPSLSNRKSRAPSGSSAGSSVRQSKTLMPT